MQHEFGSTLERLRKQRKLSFRGMSEALEESAGVSIDASGIQRIETGAREPRLYEAIAIANLFGTTVQSMAQPTKTTQSVAELRGLLERYERARTSIEELEQELVASANELRQAAERIKTTPNILLDPEASNVAELLNLLKKIDELLREFDRGWEGWFVK